MKSTRLKPVSKKRSKILRKESELKKILLVRSGGRCEICGQLPDAFGLSKHEIKTRAEGGDPLNPENCLMTCRSCHDKETTRKGSSDKTAQIRKDFTYSSPVPKWLKYKGY